MAAFSIAFAVIFLGDAEPVIIAGITIPKIFFFLLFTTIFTVVILFLKLRVYSKEEEGQETYLFPESERKPKRRWGALLMLCLAVGALFLPLIFSVILEPLWSLIAICGFVAAFNIPEIILYLYSRHSIEKEEKKSKAH